MYIRVVFVLLVACWGSILASVSYVKQAEAQTGGKINLIYTKLMKQHNALSRHERDELENSLETFKFAMAADAVVGKPTTGETNLYKAVVLAKVDAQRAVKQLIGTIVDSKASQIGNDNPEEIRKEEEIFTYASDILDKLTQTVAIGEIDVAKVLKDKIDEKPAEAQPGLEDALKRLVEGVKENVEKVAREGLGPKYDVKVIYELLNSHKGIIDKLLKDRTSVTSDDKERLENAIKDALIENFFKGFYPVMKDRTTYKNLPSVVYFVFALYNELHQELSGVPYFCVAANKEAKRNPPLNIITTSFEDACKIQLTSLFRLAGLSGFDEIGKSALPGYAIAKVQRQFAVAIRDMLETSRGSIKKLSEWYDAAKPQLESRIRAVLDILGADASDGESDIDFDERTDPSTIPSSSQPTLRSIAPTFFPVPPQPVIISATGSEDPAATMDKRLDDAIKEKKLLNAGDFTPGDLEVISKHTSMISKFVKNVDHKTLSAQKESLKKDICGKAEKPVEELDPDSDLYKAWHDVCGFQGYLWYVIIACAVILAIGLAFGIFFWMRKSN